MQNRAGEKFNWVGGFCGGFIWVLLLSCIWLFQGKVIEGITGLIVVLLALGMILFFSPWRNPNTPYWKLMLPIYFVLFGSIAWAVWSFGGIGNSGLNGWFVLVLIPILIPFGTNGKRRWNDSIKSLERSI